MSVFIARRGGGGSIPWDSAILHIYAPAGSAVSVKKSSASAWSAVKEHPVADSDSEYIYYVKAADFGTWTVKATLSQQQAESTVTVASNMEYTVRLSYRVPFEYQEVEYLKSNGNQYLITECAVKPGFRVVADFTIDSYVSSKGVFGWQTSGNYGVICQTYNNHFRVVVGSSSSVTKSTSGDVNVNTLYHYEFTSSNGDTSSATFSTDGSSETIAVNSNIVNITEPIWIFAFASNGIINGKIYSFKVYGFSGEVQCELIPCYRKSDNKPGMWDRIAEKFYTNSGNGEFSVGGDVS